MIQDTLKQAIKRLKKSSDSPALDAELLLAHCLGKSRTYLHTWPEAPISEAQANTFERFLLKRLDDYPVAYLLGSKSFWTLDLIVTPDVLIPRPETELLVETALEKIADIEKPNILDLGTGSGAIALTLASERADAKITATDYSNKALNIAIKNAQKNRLEDQITFIQSNWFNNIAKQTFDVIVSNPPYIDPEDPHLLETIRFEPQQALIADNNGMKDIEIIIKNSPAYLKKKGWLLLEHGYDQGEKTCELLSNTGLNHSHTLRDLNNLPRISLAQKDEL